MEERFSERIEDQYKFPSLGEAYIKKDKGTFEVYFNNELVLEGNHTKCGAKTGLEGFVVSELRKKENENINLGEVTKVGWSEQYKIQTQQTVGRKN